MGSQGWVWLVWEGWHAQWAGWLCNPTVKTIYDCPFRSRGHPQNIAEFASSPGKHDHTDKALGLAGKRYILFYAEIFCITSIDKYNYVWFNDRAHQWTDPNDHFIGPVCGVKRAIISNLEPIHCHRFLFQNEPSTCKYIVNNYSHIKFVKMANVETCVLV